MNTDPSFYLGKIRRLTQALFISGALNIGMLVFLSYWIAKERVPVSYFDLRPAALDQQEMSLADPRNCLEVITSLHQETFNELLNKLHHTRLIENGYKERDLALASLIAFHHFDLNRALTEAPLQKRVLKWKNPSSNEWMDISVYPGLGDDQFQAILQFARTESWPFTSQGLFAILQKQKNEENIDSSLMEAFLLTPEFLTIEILFSRLNSPIDKQKLVQVILDGNWSHLKAFVRKQRQINDLSDARRQKFLLDYIKQGSQAAAYLLLETDVEFATKKLEDGQVLDILQLLPIKTVESEKFALDLLTGPRGNRVWQQASLRLYEYTGESLPSEWNYQAALNKFAPNAVKIEPTLPLLHMPNPPATLTNISLPTPKPVITEVQVNQLKPVKVTKPMTTKPMTIAKSPNPSLVSKPVKQASAPVSKKETKIAVNSVNPTNVGNKEAKQKIAITENVKKSAGPRVYIVQEGDSLWKISKRFGVKVEAIKKFNQLNSDAIKPGTVLKIPV